MSEPFPKFDLHNSRFDQSKFSGRLQQIMAQFNPAKLLLKDEELDQAMDLLAKVKAGDTLPAGTTDKDLWMAKEMTEGLVHPDDGKKINKFFTFAAYVPMQPPITLGLIWPGAGLINQCFWQWFNQSYNAMVWYHNKNKSSATSDGDSDGEVLRSYCIATGTALGLATAFQKLPSLLSIGGALGTALAGAAPFAGCVGAGWASLVAMRYDELERGVFLKDKRGEVYEELGRSRVAAREGLAKCCAARVIWNVPVLVLTPALLHGYYRTRFNAAHPRLRLPAQLLFTTVGICLGMYPAQAVFTQTAEIGAERLEEPFRGRGVETYYYNKGL